MGKLLSRRPTLGPFSPVDLLVLASAAFLLVFNSWAGSQYNSDEIIYLDMARNMLASGNPLDLVFQGAVLHQRPPLALWLLSASCGLFGFDVFATRLPSILMAFASLVILLRLGAKLGLGGFRARLAVLLLLSTHLFYFTARRPMTDLCFLAGCLWFFCALLDLHKGHLAALSVGLAASWMAMTKGVVAFLPMGAGGLFLLLTGRLPSPRILLSALFPFLALTAPWHLLQWARHGSTFWAEYIGFNVLQRAGTSLFAESDPSFYLRELLRFEGILGLLLPAAPTALAALTIVRRARHPNQAPNQAHLLILLWWVCCLFPFFFAQTKLYHYLLPSAPAMCLAIAAILPATISLPLRAASFLGALVFFLGACLPHLVRPDYSPQQTQLAAALAPRLPATTQVCTYNHYDLVFFWDLNRPVDIRADNPAFLSRTLTIPEHAKNHSVSVTDLAALQQGLLDGDLVVLTPEFLVESLCGGLGRPLCTGEGRPVVLVQRDLALVGLALAGGAGGQPSPSQTPAPVL
jgi:4-amino-4-deoxy-L-arabinose transferase-like glycosyltransferase